MSEEKRACLDTAQRWLDHPAPENLRYAALDFRMLMEMVTYEKLRAASDVVPPAVLYTWQPRQAVQALLKFQPLAGQTFKIEIGRLPAETPFEK